MGPRQRVSASQGVDEKFKLNASSINQYPSPRCRWSMTGDWGRLKARIEDENLGEDEAEDKDEVSVHPSIWVGQQSVEPTTAPSWSVCVFRNERGFRGGFWGRSGEVSGPGIYGMAKISQIMCKSDKTTVNFATSTWLALWLISAQN